MTGAQNDNEMYVGGQTNRKVQVSSFIIVLPTNETKSLMIVTSMASNVVLTAPAALSSSCGRVLAAHL